MSTVPQFAHPCFDEQAHDTVGRVHLPVAPRCNIRCAYCERRVCPNLTVQHPGWAREVVSPEQALALVQRLVDAGKDARGVLPSRRGGVAPPRLPPMHQSLHPHQGRGALPAPTEPGHPPLVVGVAGPGEPLANDATFAALDLIHQAFPALPKCISSNGLLLAESLPRLLAGGVRALTVTVNAADPEVGQGIYEWVRLGKATHRGREAAEVLIARQFAGLAAALAAGLRVKVNTVLVPGVNDHHLPALAQRLAEVGVTLMNVIPLIPGGHMRGLRAPTCDELRAARLACEAYVPQFHRCEQCSADVVRLPRAAST